jgi:putative membrane protein
MENGLREKIVDEFAKNGMKLLEVCTSDTHYSAKIVRTKEGYYHFGKVTSAQQISDWFVKIAKQAEKRLEPASFEILEKKSNIKVMGTAVFGDFSKALDRCINMSKVFMGGCVAFFIGTLFL